MKIFLDFETAIKEMIRFVIVNGYKIQPNNWQGMNTAANREAEMIERLNWCFQVPLRSADLQFYRDSIRPNLPWADEHFMERVSGIPYNPPPSSSNWPFALNDNAAHKDEKGEFDHTYPERFWPKLAGGRHDFDEIMGIRYPYGDLSDVINLLLRDPTTRQALIPIWFPEDTGAVGDIRVPCSVGFNLIQRHGFFHITYWIRSMDIYRHARNDIYMAVRLLLWVLEKLREKGPDQWGEVKPGLFSMHCVSTHCFVVDEHKLRKQL